MKEEKLSDWEKRDKVFEALGYRYEPRFKGDNCGYWVMENDEWIIFEEIPDYFEDLNAVRELEDKIFKIKDSSYKKHYFNILILVTSGFDVYTNSWSDLTPNRVGLAIMANAEQRMNAIGISLGLWTNENS